MFQLHDNSRRRLCLGAFFGLCVAPTVIVLACGVARHLPGHVAAEARRLTWQLGPEVSLNRVRHLRPGVVVYEGLELSDPETGSRILRCRTLQARWQRPTDQDGPSRRILLLRASQSEIEADQLTQLWRLVQRTLTCRAGCPDADVRLQADELMLLRGDTRQTLTELYGKIERLSGGSQLDVGFYLAEAETPEPVQIRIARNHQVEPPATGLGLYTGGSALPCSLVALGVPELEALGPRSRFCGYLWVNATPQGRDGELVGQFTDVDLEGLVARHFPHALRATAQLTIQRARFHQGRLEEASGSMVAGPGLMSRSLLDAAAGRLGLVRGLEPDMPNGLVSYEQLALSFRIDSQGLTPRGACLPAGSAAILVGRYGILLREPIRQPVPVAALVQALVPTGEVQVPATRETNWLLSRLPVPRATALRTADAASPVVH